MNSYLLKARTCCALAILICVAPGCAELQRSATSVATQQSDFPVTTKPSIEQAQGAYELGHFANARALFSELLAREPDSIQAELGLAETLLAVNETNAAGAHFLRVSEKSTTGHTRARAQLGLGIVRLRAGKVSAAREALERSTQSDPSLWRAWLALGQVHDWDNNVDAARRAYDRAEESASGEAIVLNDIGVSRLTERRITEAISYFERALALDPEFSLAQQNIRLAYAAMGNYSEAIAGAGQDKLPSILNNVGYIAMLNGDFETAEAFLNDAVRLSPFHNETAVANLELLEATRNGSVRG